MVVATPSKKRTLHYVYNLKQLIKPLAAKLGVSLATAYCAVHEMDETGDPYHHEAKPGCPPSLFPRTKMCIKCSILKGAKCVLKIQASAHTISRFLNSIGLHAHRPCRKHKLTKLSACVRCVWAESLRNCTDTEWKLVVFVMVCLIRVVCTPPTISDHLRLHHPTLYLPSDAHSATLS